MEDILVRLWPAVAGDGMMIFLSIWRYVIILLLAIVLLMQPDGSTFYTILLGASILLVMMDSAWLFTNHQITAESSAIALKAAWEDHNQELPTIAARALPTVFALFVAGGTRNKKSMAPAILAALLGGIHFFMTWFLYQK